MFVFFYKNAFFMCVFPKVFVFNETYRHETMNICKFVATNDSASFATEATHSTKVCSSGNQMIFLFLTSVT